jgi:short-subunit dehydrogenase
MSSMAAVRGTLLVAPYAATKAFTWNLMESLHYEYLDTDLDFASMCAGPIATPNYLGTKPHNSLFLPKPDSPDYVAQKALMQIGRRPVDFPGTGNRLSNIILTRLLPRSWAAGITNRVMAKTYPQYWSD